MGAIQQAVDWIVATGPYGVVALVLWSSYKRMWVWGTTYDKVVDELRQVKERNAQLEAINRELQFLAWAGTGMAKELGKGTVPEK